MTIRSSEEEELVKQIDKLSDRIKESNKSGIDDTADMEKLEILLKRYTQIRQRICCDGKA
ncbi:hypothetical protein [Anaerospora hongkongensis]|uniref:hypothetical protein n=1 Tax=Anaerospora hongkongensis TaxID=244830 RepID=UPI002FD93301